MGSYEPYQLSHFIQSRDLLVDKGELVELAHTENDKLVINPKAIEIFKRYPDYDISFVGNYGKVNSGKSFWYDKILNLSQIDGHGVKSSLFSIPITRNIKGFTSGVLLLVKGT